MNSSLPQYSDFEKKLDQFITRSSFAIPIFLFLIFIIFEITFRFGNFLAGYFDIFFIFIRGKIILDSTFFDAIYGGISGVFVYLPNIVILYVFLFLLQDSGILSRVSYIFDKHLKKIGLSGNSFLSLFLGFGCTIPAILSTKTIINKQERILSVMLLPFITCSAKLPVLVLFISIFIPIGFQSLFLILLYIVSVLFGILSQSLISYFIPARHQKMMFHLPRYKIPEWKCLLRQTYFLLKDFLGKVSLYIIPFSLLLTLAFSYPQNVALENTYGGQVGKSLSVVFAPIGMNDKMSISIVSGLIGKEVVVATLGSLYYIEDGDTKALTEKILADKSITLPSALSFVIFILLYTPCMGAVATVFRELGRFWGIFFLIYPIIFAWVMSFIVFSIAK